MDRLKDSPSDEDSWSMLYSHLWPFVLGVTYRRLGGDRDLAQDAAQETFLRLARACPFNKLPDADALRAYLWRVADNLARSYRSSLQGQTPEAARLLDETATRQPTADKIVETRERLARSVKGLPALDREMILMIGEGYSLGEVAEATGLSYSNAGVRLHRLRNRLRKLLEA